MNVNQNVAQNTKMNSMKDKLRSLKNMIKNMMAMAANLNQGTHTSCPVNNHFDRPESWRDSIQAIECDHCKKSGHVTEECCQSGGAKYRIPLPPKICH